MDESKQENLEIKQESKYNVFIHTNNLELTNKTNIFDSFKNFISIMFKQNFIKIYYIIRCQKSRWKIYFYTRGIYVSNYPY